MHYWNCGECRVKSDFQQVRHESGKAGVFGGSDSRTEGVPQIWTDSKLGQKLSHECGGNL